jgi:predicted phosphodiesterase
MVAERIIVCPDAHHPFVDERAWACFLEAAYVARANRVVIIGDFGDFYQVSRYFKARGRPSFAEELEAVNDALDEIEQLGVPVDFCAGNHEHRYDAYLQEKAPELLGVAPDLPALLRMRQRPGIAWHGYGDLLRVGHMHFIHDVGRSGKNAARESLADLGSNIVFGHTHRLGVAYEGTSANVPRVSLNVGWLGDFDAVDYRHRCMARRSWQHGFGLVDIDSDGVGYCQAVPIIDGRCLVDGKVARA